MSVNAPGELRQAANDANDLANDLGISAIAKPQKFGQVGHVWVNDEKTVYAHARTA